MDYSVKIGLFVYCMEKRGLIGILLTGLTGLYPVDPIKNSVERVSERVSLRIK